MSAFATVAYPQTATKAFIHIPDDVIPFTNEEMRDILCHKYAEMHSDSDNVNVNIETAYGGFMSIKKANESFMEVELSKNSSIEIIVDTLKEHCIYTIRNYMAPAADTQIDQWTADWKHIRTIKPQYGVDDFLSPDLSTRERDEALKLVELPMYEAHWIEQEQQIELKLSLPLVTKEDKQKYEKYYTSKRITLD